MKQGFFNDVSVNKSIFLLNKIANSSVKSNKCSPATTGLISLLIFTKKSTSLFELNFFISTDPNTYALFISCFLSNEII